jgi:hypothetical protein
MNILQQNNIEHISDAQFDECFDDTTTDIYEDNDFGDIDFNTNLLADFHNSPNALTSLIKHNGAIIESRSTLLLKSLENYYYNNHDKLQEMLSIIGGSSRISLRIIDWFVTNYAKHHGIVFPVENETGFHVHSSYKLKLKGYSKHYLDPFCRYNRISIKYDENSSVETTIGQLNFFKWAFENNIIQYVNDNFKLINDDMNQRNSTSVKRNKNTLPTTASHTTTRKKRQELSVNATKTYTRDRVNVIVKFS